MDGGDTRAASPELTDGALDEVDARIIEQLEMDGRRSYTRIASELSISESAVRRRIQRLTRTGTIRVVAVTDPCVLGLRVQAMVGIGVDGDYESIAESLAAIPEVGRVLVTAGEYDLVAEVSCSDHDELLEVLNRKLRTVPGVRSMSTMTVLKSHEGSRRLPS